MTKNCTLSLLLGNYLYRYGRHSNKKKWEIGEKVFIVFWDHPSYKLWCFFHMFIHWLSGPKVVISSFAFFFFSFITPLPTKNYMDYISFYFLNISKWTFGVFSECEKHFHFYFYLTLCDAIRVRFPSHRHYKFFFFFQFYPGRPQTWDITIFRFFFRFFAINDWPYLRIFSYHLSTHTTDRFWWSFAVHFIWKLKLINLNERGKMEQNAKTRYLFATLK